jgi:hypothetical protein
LKKESGCRQQVVCVWSFRSIICAYALERMGERNAKKVACLAAAAQCAPHICSLLLLLRVRTGGIYARSRDIYLFFITRFADRKTISGGGSNREERERKEGARLLFNDN